MKVSSDAVLASLQAAFPEPRRAAILELLDTYGIESYERERDRVQLAILKLSAGSEAKLRELIAVAKMDYRDVLLWADNPSEAELDTPEKRKRVAAGLQQLGIKPPPDLLK